MAQTELPIDDTALRAFLLGKLPQEDAERLEERLISDRDFFEEIEAVETELFDDYVRNALSPDDRASFASRYGEQSSRLTAARVFARRAAAPGNIVPITRSHPFLMWAAAAAVVIAIGATFFARRPATSPTTPVAQHTIQTPQTPPVTPPAARTAVLSLALTATRDSGQIPIVTISSIDTLTLRVRLNPADRYASYGATLRGSNGMTWTAKDLHAEAKGDELVLAVAVPASALASGENRLSVSGQTSETISDLLGEVRFAVER
jgi:hypothetical protein